jgi:hypothetical protein
LLPSILEIGFILLLSEVVVVWGVKPVDREVASDSSFPGRALQRAKGAMKKKTKSFAWL